MTYLLSRVMSHPSPTFFYASLSVHRQAFLFSAVPLAEYLVKDNEGVAKALVKCSSDKNVKVNPV